MKNILVAFLFILNSNLLLACMCGPDMPIKERIEKSDYVALVTIKDIVSMGTHAYYKTIINEVTLFKGKSSTELITYGSNRLVDPNYLTNCDILLRKEEQWVIFGKYKNGKIEIHYCDGSFIYRYSNGYRNIMDGGRIKQLNQVSEYFQKPVFDFYKKNGVLRVDYPNGNTEMIAHFKNGVKQGLTSFFYPDGKLITNETYVLGKLNGKRIKYFEEGTINTIEYFKNGIKIDSSNSYEFNVDSGRYYMWQTSFFTKNGQMISNKIYSIPMKYKGMPSLFNEQAFYLRDEWFTDTIKNETTHLSYHPNGRVKTKYLTNAKTFDIIGDEVTMDSLGRVTKILRSNKGAKTQVIYIDSAAWPYLIKK